jgi:glycosyltransferase involved in cell wall biosynthesis
MRAGVYNAFWPSMGGGERHSGRLAQALADDGWDVDLVGFGGVSRDTLASRLSLDLSQVRLRRLPAQTDDYVAAASADYDLFVNASYMSRVMPRAATNIYLCYFPTPFDHDYAPWRRWLVRHGTAIARGARGGFHHGKGWFPPEGGRRRSWTWSNGRGVLYLDPATPRLLIAKFARPGQTEPVEVTLESAGGTPVARLTVSQTFKQHRIRLPAHKVLGDELVVRSSTFVPGPADPRRLGVAVSGLRFGTRLPIAEQIGSRWPWLLLDPANVDFLANYDRVLANSAFTAGWIRRLWGAEADVLYPPIRLDALPPAEPRDRLIVSVGRFFAPGYGHSKRQLEMVRFFGELISSGALPGWRFAVIGGCEASQKPYLATVSAASEGLPVDVIPNASRELVDRLLSRAAVFWSATGYGERENQRPWALEHFGMTTVEAMSAGAVPVVIDLAGQREIVRDGVDGFRWRTVDDLKQRTIEVAEDEALRRQLSASAMLRAREFSDEAFVDRWRAIVKGLDLSAH